MPYTVTREQRDALHAEAIIDLSEIEEIYLALENDDYRLAQELWRRYEPLLALLDQIGWGPRLADQVSVAEVAMPDAQLVSAVHRLTRVVLGRLRHRSSSSDSTKAPTLRAHCTASRSQRRAARCWSTPRCCAQLPRVGRSDDGACDRAG